MEALPHYWTSGSQEARDAGRAALTTESVKTQYLSGADALQVSPDGYMLDLANLSRPGADKIQLDLIYDYRHNVDLCPEWQAYLPASKPPLLAVWGENDGFLLPAGAKAFLRDVPDAEISLYDTGHFALETHAKEIGAAALDFLDRRSLLGRR